MAGRKTKLTKEITDEIVKRIRAGNYIKVACQAVGISHTAYFDWIKKGEDGISPYAEFLYAVKKSRSRSTCKLCGDNSISSSKPVAGGSLVVRAEVSG